MIRGALVGMRSARTRGRTSGYAPRVCMPFLPPAYPTPYTPTQAACGAAYVEMRAANGPFCVRLAGALTIMQNHRYQIVT